LALACSLLGLPAVANAVSPAGAPTPTKKKRKYTTHIDKQTRARLQIHHLEAPQLKRTFRYMVYLPKEGIVAGKRYPLLVMLHGLGEYPHGWLTLGKIHRVIDDLVDEKRMPAPLILLASGGNGYWSNWVDGNHQYGDLVVRRYLEDMRRRYPIARRADLTAIAGCSMGGFGALSLGLQYPELFGFVVALSATDMQIAVQLSPKRKIYTRLVGSPPSARAVERINPRHLVVRGHGSPSQRFLLIYGSREGRKFGEGSERVAKAMQLRGLDVEVFRVPDAGHGWKSSWARAHPWWISALAERWTQASKPR
jgi:enterochelin esterase-like enzyme